MYSFLIFACFNSKLSWFSALYFKGFFWILSKNFYFNFKKTCTLLATSQKERVSRKSWSLTDNYSLLIKKKQKSYNFVFLFHFIPSLFACLWSKWESRGQEKETWRYVMDWLKVVERVFTHTIQQNINAIWTKELNLNLTIEELE